MYLQKPPLGTQLDWNNPLNKGVVMHLAMNEGHGDKVQDLSMNGNHGTLKNMASSSTATSGWNPGQTGVGVNFDGTNDYIQCQNSQNLQLGDGSKGTVSIIVKSDIPWLDHLDYTGLIQKGDSSGWISGAYSITSWTADLRFKIQHGTSSAPADGTYIGIPFPTIQEWHQFVMTWDGTILIGYVNGIEINSAPQTVNADLNPTENLWIGKSIDRNFNGAIDQPRIMNRAWTAKEVMDYYINPWQVYLDEDD